MIKSIKRRLLRKQLRSKQPESVQKKKLSPLLRKKSSKRKKMLSRRKTKVMFFTKHVSLKRLLLLTLQLSI